MNNSKQKIVLYLALIFLAGGVAGAAIAWNKGGPPSKQHSSGGKPDSKRMCDFMKKRLQERVGLTQEQVETVDPILKKSCKEIEKIHERTLSDVEESIRRAHAEIATHLTDEQRAKLDQFEADRREFWRKRFKKEEKRDKDLEETNNEKIYDLKAGENYDKETLTK